MSEQQVSGRKRKRKRASSISKDPSYVSKLRSTTSSTPSTETLPLFSRSSERLRLKLEGLEREELKREQHRRAFTKAEPSIPPEDACPLMTVPPEIRNLVYGFLFESTFMYVNTRDKHARQHRISTLENVRCAVPILKTCRLIRNEAQSALCKAAIIFLKHTKRYNDQDSETLLEAHKQISKSFQDCIESNPVLKFGEKFRLRDASDAYVLEYLPNVRSVTLHNEVRKNAFFYNIEVTKTLSEMAEYLTSEGIHENLIHRYFEDMEVRAQENLLEGIGWEVIKRISERDRVQIQASLRVDVTFYRHELDRTPLEMFRSIHFDIATRKVLSYRMSFHGRYKNNFKCSDEALAWLLRYDWEELYESSDDEDDG